MDGHSRSDMNDPRAVRRLCREGAFDGLTAGVAMGRVQANLVVVEKAVAFEFLLFCQRNPKPCPILDVTEAGETEPRAIAPGADIRTDLPRYRVWRDGVLEAEPTDVSDIWRDDFVGFLIGCSFTFENAMADAGLPLRHLERDSNVPMYVTNRACAPAGRFAGPMVVSMRPMTPAQAVKATEVTARYPRAHGAPVHLGDPAEIGIGDLDRPDFGDPVPVHLGDPAEIGIGDLDRPDFGDPVPLGEDEIPVFWACGVTPQAVIMERKPAIAITHAPGHMFVADLRDEALIGA